MTRRIALKRVYDDVQGDDGVRVLVDRLWPRGVSKRKARIDAWYKEIAPSDSLRKWFHASGDYSSFVQRYRRELTERAEAKTALQRLVHLVQQSERVTLVYASKDEQHNNAVVLKCVLEEECEDA